MELKRLCFDAIVVGSGAAAFNAANRLCEQGVRNLAVVCEQQLAGTSRNAGSDKQTYYKLTTGGAEADSVEAMAQTLFDGGCMDGDLALAEAAGSLRSFMNLLELGVAFPSDRFGQYPGYKTDHDPLRRGTSAGPLTSRQMTEALQKRAELYGITILDHLMAIKILQQDGKFQALLCLKTDATGLEPPFWLLQAKGLIYAAGGPASIYQDTVYPHGQYGMSGIAFAAGVAGRNLTEWQYGLASLRPKWNVSGTYMQAIPRFVSTDRAGGDAKEFCAELFDCPEKLLNLIFLKGYQWPFDVRKVMAGSSLLDLLVYQETVIKGRRVFLDYRDNPLGRPLDYSLLSPEAAEYLESAGAGEGRPIDRLIRMNRPAYEFYLAKGVDLDKEMLEIALCAQHNNGGLAVDAWWRTEISGLYAVGECAGTHGVYRPGGSALNSGQVGGLRAAQSLASALPELSFSDPDVRGTVRPLLEMAEAAIGPESNLTSLQAALQQKMSACAGPIRDREQMALLLAEVSELLADFGRVRIRGRAEWPGYFHFYDSLLAQKVYLAAMQDYLERGGHSRGSAFCLDTQGEVLPAGLPDQWRLRLAGPGEGDHRIQEVRLRGMEVAVEWRERHPIPQQRPAFEAVWRGFRDNGNID